ncbi:cell wall protein DAN4-like isoform X3 [Xiphophorus maculatus]|uniref:cell wall protein DAN4-like isoform X3 n=1 Tax=Xiphophorus maculatus TaxID=8083 RepID=UPI000C6E5794|nr:cell wall protein DAN4-like isoform X3 [Xiphophorus maculatus]
MASVVFKKDTGIFCLLLSGFLLPSVFMSGQTTAADMSTTSSPTDPATTTTASTMNTTTSAANLTMTISTATSNTNQAASMTSSSSAATLTQSTMSTTYGGTVMSTAIQSPTTNSDSVSQNTHSTSTTSGGPTSVSTHSPSTTSGGPSSHSTHSASSTSGGSSSSGTHSISATSEGNMTEENKNTTSNSSMEMINCPSFSCYCSDCYSKYNSQNKSYCSAGESCQLLKSMDMWYNVSCSASCVEDWNNTSQRNCSVNCCNSTRCVKDIFASMMMMMTTTVAATTTTNAPPTTRTTSTTANKGNKCHKGSCTGENCYKNFKDLETCSSTNPHCQLKKETASSGVVWTAGCTNCTGYAACTGTTNPPCNLECCTATTTSCLILNGTLNVPSFATRGPYLHIELIASLVCLLAITLLL